MQAGIVGLPGSGRTTVFRALLAHRARTASSGQRAATIGAIHVQDPRLERLAARFDPRKTTPIEITLHDVCSSLEPSFPTGELEALKRMDALLLVLPGFREVAPDGAAAELDRLVGELCLEDLGAVERRLERARKERTDAAMLPALEAARSALDAERPIAAAALAEPLRRELRAHALVTDRPMVAVCNVAEADVGRPTPEALHKRCAELGMAALSLCAPLEAEMAELAAADRAAFLGEYGIEEPAGAAVTRALLAAADLIPFYTVGEDECRAWAIPRGTTAREAAGKIHSDLERGFIRAEVIDCEELCTLEGLLVEARKKGVLRLEGKDYVVREGDVMHVRFNV